MPPQLHCRRLTPGPNPHLSLPLPNSQLQQTLLLLSIPCKSNRVDFSIVMATADAKPVACTPAPLSFLQAGASKLPTAHYPKWLNTVAHTWLLLSIHCKSQSVDSCIVMAMADANSAACTPAPPNFLQVSAIKTLAAHFPTF